VFLAELSGEHPEYLVVGCALPAEVNRISIKAMEMAGRGTQTFTELTGHRTSGIITFMSLMFLIPVRGIREDKMHRI
jgi:hypothetical protein